MGHRACLLRAGACQGIHVASNGQARARRLCGCDRSTARARGLMRIAIDAREMSGRPTGVGRYLSEILRAWNQLPVARAHEFVLCSPAPIALPASGLRLTTAIAAGRGTLWEQWTLPRLVTRAGADVLFAPAYTAPVRCRVPVVLTIHDVSFAARPEWFTWREGLRRRTLTRMSARR